MAICVRTHHEWWKGATGHYIAAVDVIHPPLLNSTFNHLIWCILSASVVTVCKIAHIRTYVHTCYVHTYTHSSVGCVQSWVIWQCGYTKCPISMYIFYGTVTQNLKGPHYMAIHHQHVCTLSDLVQLQLPLYVLYNTSSLHSFLPVIPMHRFQFHVRRYSVQCLSYVVIRHGRGLLFIR